MRRPAPTWSMSAAIRCNATTGALMSAPRSNRDEASVFRPSRLLVRRTDDGLKYALSNATIRVVVDTSAMPPPMTPATACARSRSAMTSMSASSARSTPSSVVIRSLALRPPHANLGAGELLEVERVGGMAELDQHVVGDVDNRS